MPVQTVILDASTLILLAKTDLLRIWVAQVSACMPKVVYQEVTVKQHLYDAQLIAQLVKDGKINVETSRSFQAQAKEIKKQFKIGPGEAAALALAREKKAILATDDGVAIKAAKVFEIEFITSLHILSVLCERQSLDAKTALAKLDLLEMFGRYGSSLIADTRINIQKGR